MINKRLIKLVPESLVHIKRNIIFQIISLIANISLILALSNVLHKIVTDNLTLTNLISTSIFVLILILIRVSFNYFASKESYKASFFVKGLLRKKIYEKIVSLGARYSSLFPTAKLTQMSVEGVEQLEVYFGSYLPQFFYSMIAPVILFIVVSTINIKVAIVLFICVPLIPISILLIQKFAKKLLAKYWGEYLGLADNFLENLQGLNTLKIYKSDDFKQTQMNNQAERFRIITMKVLSMQLNSIIVMDIVAYGGAALGIITSLLEFKNGNINFANCFFIIMLSADFFLPLRILGSYFHIAMNGIAASKNIFELLDIKENDKALNNIADTNIKIENLNFSYNNEKVILKNININIPKNSFISLVGKSGCGKSTIAGILTGFNKNYAGSVKIGDFEHNTINYNNLLENITLISNNSYIFKGTIRENLLMAKQNATDSELLAVLETVKLKDFLYTENGLDTIVLEKGSNLSGGQCQRLALARALLHNTDIYIFDEATSNIDVESEDSIMQVLHSLKNIKTIILISHRLFNVVNSDMIYVLNDGEVVEKGTHDELIFKNGYYENLYTAQKKLENVGDEYE